MVEDNAVMEAGLSTGEGSDKVKSLLANKVGDAEMVLEISHLTILFLLFLIIFYNPTWAR